jgi:hypothetical protein
LGAQLEHLESILRDTGHICADCGTSLTFTEECVILQVVQPEVMNGRVAFYPIVDSQDGTFTFEPYYYCFECWESQYEALREETTDQKPIEDKESAFDCLCCASGIRPGEYTATFTFGEFRLSMRSPNGQPSAQFHPASGNPEMLCLYCLVILNTQIEMWDDISQSGECSDCISVRCWRGSECECACHQPSEEDYENGR